jgi:hypothetical protein
MSEERLRQELDAAHRQRGLVYLAVYRELTQELGAEKAEAILARAIYARGREVADAAFAQFGPNDAVALGEAFLALSPDEGRLFPTEVSPEGAEAITVKVLRCPLKDAWVEAGVSEEEVAILCRMAGRFDTGLFERSGCIVATETWRPGRGGCCRITLRNRRTSSVSPIGEG